MATNWTLYSNPQQVLVIHYENVKHNLLPEMRKILNFLNLPVDELRLQCLEKYKNGLFRRNKVTQESNNVIAFSLQIRSSMDKLIDHVNQHIMIKRGYEALPLDKYKYYKQVRPLHMLSSQGSKNSWEKPIHLLFHKEFLQHICNTFYLMFFCISDWWRNLAKPQKTETRAKTQWKWWKPTAKWQNSWYSNATKTIHEVSWHQSG